jgi:hypothetical protein
MNYKWQPLKTLFSENSATYLRGFLGLDLEV